jgi:hypothetical protein
VEGYNAEEAWMRQMMQFKAVMQGLDCPWFPVAGNHDIYWRGADRPKNEHELHFEEHFGPLWYDFDHRNSHFIVLYTDEGNPQTGERNFSKPDCQVMSGDQLGFLRAALDRGSSADHVFVFLHHPRWLKGGYGDDWDRIHEVLADAGNVAVCFAGHIHQMRHDGVRDGIEYVSLATVGGHQNFFSPEAGWDHQFHVVTVRPDLVSMAAVPINKLMDVRDITGTVSADTRKLTNVRPRFAKSLRVDSRGGSNDRIGTSLTNPTGRPVMAEITPKSADARWRFSPEKTHQRIGPGETAVFSFEVLRSPLEIDDTFSPPTLAIDLEYLTELRSYTIPTVETTVPIELEFDPPTPPAQESMIALNGFDEALRIPNQDFSLPQGPMTLEVRINGDDFKGRRGLVTKTELSEYGFFGSNGVPEFLIYLGDAYVTVRAPETRLEPGREYHLAGVYDGSEVRFYIDGKLEARLPGSGMRRTNNLPLVIGADVDEFGNPVSFIGGTIDEIRLSRNARYTGEGFKVPRRFEPDPETVLLFHFDGAYGPYHHDASGSDAHAIAVKNPRIIVAPRGDS